MTEERVRLIIDAPVSDLRKTFELALSAHEGRDRSHAVEWDFWSSDDPTFTAHTRINRKSISVRAERKSR